MTKMTGSKSKWWRIFLSLTMALILAMSLFAMAACKKGGNDDDDDNDTEETQVDEQIIKNGNFEFVGNDPTYPVTSINNWSKSYASTTPDVGKNNPTSKYTSGVIDTKGLDELSFNSNSDEEDEQLSALKKVDPKTRFTDDELEENGSNILMLANKYSGDVNGTAQKATSSTTLTIEAGTAIKVSVWVRTNGFPGEGDYTDKTLKNAEGNSVDGKAGAYIGVNNTAGSATAAPLYIKNIDTLGEWQQYTLIIRASDYTTSKVQLVLGLGMGYALTESSSGPQGNPAEYVEGFAFFDDITYEVLPISASNATDEDAVPYDDASYAAVNEMSIFKEVAAPALPSELIAKNEPIAVDASLALGSADNALVNIGTADAPEYAVKLSFARITFDENIFDTNLNIQSDISLSTTKTDTGTVTAPVDERHLSGIDTYNNLKVKYDYTDFLKNFPFESAATNNILMLRAKNPSAYTAMLTDNGSSFKLEAGKYASVSMWIKTSAIKSGEGAGFTIVDKGNNLANEDDWVSTSFSAIDTTSIETDPDFYDGWTKYTFYLYNDAKTQDRFYEIKLTFGLTTQSTDKNNYNSGYAAFTNLFIEDDLPEDIYNAATAGTYVKKVTLNAQANLYSSNSGFDTISPSDRYAANGDERIETIPVIPNSYVGTIGGTNKTGGRNEDGTPHIPNPEDAAAAGVIRGLINYRHIDAYGLAGLNLAALGNAVQPLVIQNTVPATYGFISKSSKQFAANSITALEIDVKVIGNAKAYIYLTNSSASEDFKLLTLDRPAVDNSENDRDSYTAESKDLMQVVDGSKTNDWVTVRFFVITGSKSVDYNLELWNGSRDGKTQSEGTVLFDRLSTSTSLTQDEYDAFLELIKDDSSADIVKFTQQAREFYMTEEELEEDAEYDHSDEEEEDVDSYEEMIMYAYRAVGDTAKDSDYLMFLNYTTINVDTTHSHGDDEEQEEGSTGGGGNSQIWLMISSLILAVVLIFVLLLVSIRRFKAKATKKRIDATTRYKGKRVYKRKSKESSDELELEDDEDAADSDDKDEVAPAIKLNIDEDFDEESQDEAEEFDDNTDGEVSESEATDTDDTTDESNADEPASDEQE